MKPTREDRIKLSIDRRMRKLAQNSCAKVTTKETAKIRKLEEVLTTITRSE